MIVLKNRRVAVKINWFYEMTCLAIAREICYNVVVIEKGGQYGKIETFEQ